MCPRQDKNCIPVSSKRRRVEPTSSPSIEMHTTLLSDEKKNNNNHQQGNTNDDDMQKQLKVGGLAVQLSNYAARKMEDGFISESIVLLTRAADSFAKDIKLSWNYNDNLRNRPVSTTAAIMGWSETIQNKSCCSNNANEDDDLFLYRRTLVILPTLQPVTDTVHAVAILYNLALCHHLRGLELQELQEQFSSSSSSTTTTATDELELAYHFYIQAQTVLDQCDEQHPELQIVILSNLGCLQVRGLADAHGGSECFQALDFEINNLCLMATNFFLNDCDAARLALNALYNSFVATAA